MNVSLINSCPPGQFSRRTEILIAATYLYNLSGKKYTFTNKSKRGATVFKALFITGLSIISLHLIMYVGLFSQLEHRYLSPLTIWVEIGPMFYVLGVIEHQKPKVASI